MPKVEQLRLPRRILLAAALPSEHGAGPRSFSEGLYHLVHTTAPVVVTTAEAWGLRCLPRAELAAAVTYVVTGETVTPDALVVRLVEWGYHRVPLVQDPGDLALRGGILDVFPVGYGQPARLEFMGDTVESIRAFDPTSQRSLAAMDELDTRGIGWESSTGHSPSEPSRRQTIFRSDIIPYQNDPWPRSPVVSCPPPPCSPTGS